MRKILICIPQTGPMYYRDFVESYNHARNYLAAHSNLVPFEYVLAEHYCHTFPIDANRNECVAIALENGFDQTIWLDTDQEFGRETLLKLLLPDLPICAGIYHAKTPPYHPVVFMEAKDSTDFNVFNSITDFPEKEKFEADMIGMGCVAIKTEVFRALGMPYFMYQKHPMALAENSQANRFKAENGIADVSEDVWFWKQVKDKTDYKIVIDPTIIVNHLGTLKVGRQIWKSYRDGWLAELESAKGQEFVKQKLSEQCKARTLTISSAS